MKLKSRIVERRMFVSMAGGTMLGMVTVSLVGCGKSSKPEVRNAKVLTGEEYDRFFDIQTHVRGSRGFRGGVLKAADVVAGQSVVLFVDEGSHRHSYTIGKDHFAKLLAGETVFIVTERAAGHTHTMEINPATKPRNAGSVEIPEEEPEAAELFAALSSSSEPKVALQASEELSADSVEYCLGSQVSCAENAGLWRGMAKSEGSSGRQVFVSENLRPDNQEILNIRAKTKAGGLAKLVLRFLRR